MNIIKRICTEITRPGFYSLHIYYVDEAMQLMVSKILELSSDCEGCPTDSTDLAELDTAANTSNGGHMTDMAAGNGYARTGKTIAMPPSSSYHYTDKHKKSNCCN